MRFALCALLALAGDASSALGTINYLDQITGGSATGLYLCSSGNSCIDDFEINGVAGPGGGFVGLTGAQAVFISPTGALPSTFRVNIYRKNSNTENIRTMMQGDIFTQTYDLGTALIQPFPVPGETGNFPSGFLVTFNFDVNVQFGEYYLGISANTATGGPVFVSGSNMVTEGTMNDVIQIMNQGPGGSVSTFPDNAAFRVMGVPTPGAVGLLGLAGLVAVRRRR